MTRKPNGDASARRHRICFRTSRRVNAQLTDMAHELGLTKSGAVHWACAMWGYHFQRDSVDARHALIENLESSDAVDLLTHLDNLRDSEVPW